MSERRRLATTAVALCAAAVLGGACGAAPGASGTTTVTGRVLLSPAKPVCPIGQSCSRPLAGFKLVFSRDQNVVARAKTDGRGRFRVRLRPGRYSVSTPAGARRGIGRGLAPTRIGVRAVRHQVVDFTYDAGIR